MPHLGLIQAKGQESHQPFKEFYLNEGDKARLLNLNFTLQLF